MRNLSLLSTDTTSLEPGNGTNICATALDLDQHVLYAVSECQKDLDASVDVEIWKVLLKEEDGDEESRVCNDRSIDLIV